jgi:predicted acylesterase/phospholipase RssA
MRIAEIALMALAAAACAGTPYTNPINQPLVAAPSESVAELGVEGDAIALALSGGGARAASFSYGALLQLRDMKDADGRRLIDRVAVVTAVSGGAITAGWLGQHGADGLDGFRAAALDKDWQGKLHTSFVSPNNWARLLQGGLNGPDLLADWLDREVFTGGRMRDLPNRPRIVINAADLYTGAPFAFTAPYFQAICSDLASVRIADAVAASMAVPIAFRPIVVRSYAENCPAPLPTWVGQAVADRSAPILLRETARAFQLYRNPARMKFVHLADGGVTDNFGVSSLITLRRASQTSYGPFSARDSVRVKRMTFLIINAEMSAAGDWALRQEGPDGPQMIEAALSVAVNAPKRAAADAFASTLSDWERDLIEYRCSLTKEEAQSLGAGPGWDCKNVDFRLDVITFADLPAAQFQKLGAAPTQVSLPKELIDDLIAGGRQAIATNEAVKALTR